MPPFVILNITIALGRLQLGNGMENMWPILTLCLLLLVSPWLSSLQHSKDIDKLLAASFLTQAITVNGISLPARQLSVLHRAMGNIMRGQFWPAVTFDANWLCRSPDGQFWCAIAQGETQHQRLLITWSWRSLTEERARESLRHDAKAYREVFGQDDDSSNRE
ncbi:hypothetical protein [Dyella silvatica]|uniref:hypothetical protein n=1 Tax=Dyella silvatica TaxID=2992128 RepID=UPI002254BF68|nr:hypothetical protein [Dyella silvatica]